MRPLNTHSFATRFSNFSVFPRYTSYTTVSCSGSVALFQFSKALLFWIVIPERLKSAGGKFAKVVNTNSPSPIFSFSRYATILPVYSVDSCSPVSVYEQDSIPSATRLSPI